MLIKALCCGLLMVGWQAYGETNAPVALFAQFEKPAPDSVMAAMQAELDALMDPAGYKFEWHALKKASGHDVFRELVVVSFKGSCQVLDWPRAAEPNGPLGWTHMSGGELLPFTDVHCDRVQSLLRGELRANDPEDRDEILGRALARVLAHELYHVFARTKKHGSCGVSKATYSVIELTDEEFRFRDQDIEVLRARRAAVNQEVAEAEPSQ